MTLSVNGKEFKAFINADWGPGAVIEDEVVYVDGLPLEHTDYNQIHDESLVELRGGWIFPSGKNCVDAVQFAKQWFEQQRTRHVICAVDSEMTELFKAHIMKFPSAKIV